MAFRAAFMTTLLVGATTVAATPTLVSRAGVTALSPSEVAAFKPYALLARAAYCDTAKLREWSCGTACDDLPGMKVSATSGGIVEAPWFVGYYPKLDTIVVSNRGTDPGTALSSLTDADFFLTPLDPALFPGVSSSIEVHDGFKGSQAGSAAVKLAAVQALIAEHSGATVTLTGHGRGGAISQLDALFLSLHLPSSVKIKVVNHGMPRVGNQAFADYIDNHPLDVSRITNMKDPLPILPGRFLGFHHTSGEKHILSETAWVACAGQDNTDAQCSTGAVQNVFEGHPEDNEGPYDGITIDGSACA